MISDKKIEPQSVGFIGCGRHITKMLYPCLRMARMQLAAVCDLDEAKAQRIARWFGTEQVYSDHRRINEIITSPVFGPVGAVQSKLAMGWKKGSGFSLLLDLCIHIFDFLFSLQGEVVDVTFRKSVHAETHNRYAILQTFSSGSVGNLLISDDQLMVRHNERVEISGNGRFVVADNLNHLAHCLPDGEIDVCGPGFSILSITEDCDDMRIIKKIEPTEDYVKGPVDFTHWQSENTWLQ